MTTTLTTTVSAEIAIDSMPAHLRADVEKLMLDLPESELCYPEFDIWDTVWFTRWRRNADGTIACRERVVAPAADLERFRDRLAELASSAGFDAELTTRAA